MDILSAEIRYLLMRKILPRKAPARSDTLLAMLNGGQQEINSAFKLILYHNYPRVRKYILKNGGSEQDALEVLQQTFVRLVEKIRDKGLPAIGNVHAYLFRACQNHWLNDRRRASRHEPLNRELKEVPLSGRTDPYTLVERSDLKEAVHQLLSQLGDKCRKLLIWSLGEGLDMKRVAKELGYENAQTAMNIKSRCKQKLKRLVQASPSYQQLVHQVLFSD